MQVQLLVTEHPGVARGVEPNAASGALASTAGCGGGPAPRGQLLGCPDLLDDALPDVLRQSRTKDGSTEVSGPPSPPPYGTGGPASGGTPVGR